MSNLDTYKWRDRRLTSDRKEFAAEYKMLDMGEYELQQAYDHCKNMLYNTDFNNLGRMLVLDEISKQLECCGAELALRWFKQLTDANGNYLYSEENLMTELRTWLSNIPNYDPNKIYRLHDFVEVPPEYKGVSVKVLQDACRDNLGYFSHVKITIPFICRLGIYFKPSELNDINSYTKGNTLKEKFDILKYQLGLRDDTELRANPSGLTEQEFRDMIHLKTLKGYRKCKYSELTTSQLNTLRKKVLFALEEEVLFQVNVWKTLMKQIEEVVEYKHYSLN